MTIGKAQLKSDLILAPVAGYSDAGFRALCYGFGAGLCVTEMVSAKGLKYDGEKTKSLLVKEPCESPSAVQIFGNDPEIMAEICLKPEIRAFDIVDINMGCPVPKIFKNGEGCALMGNPVLAEKVIAAVRKNVKTLTVKFRAGLDAAHIDAPEFAKLCEGAGADAVTVHARTREQFYSGRADWAVIERVVRAVKIPVIGNGDAGGSAQCAVHSPQLEDGSKQNDDKKSKSATVDCGLWTVHCSNPDRTSQFSLLNSQFSSHAAALRADADRMKRETGCAAVAVARAALGRPYIFSPQLKGGDSDRNFGLADSFLLNIIERHIAVLRKYYPDAFIAVHMRHHLHKYLREMPGGKTLRGKINGARDLTELAKILRSVKS